METETSVDRSFDIGQRWASATDEEIAWFKKYLAQELSLPEKLQVAVSFGGWMGGNTLEVRVLDTDEDTERLYLLMRDGTLVDGANEEDDALDDECTTVRLQEDATGLEDSIVCCTKGHPMTLVTLAEEQGWCCDGFVCQRSRCRVTYYGGSGHLRCAECNYDICWRCVRLANEISTKTPTTREEYADLLEKFGSRELKKRVLKEPTFSPWEPELDRVCSS